MAEGGDKKPLSGSSLGDNPTTDGIRARVQGESESDYKRYIKVMQGEQARSLANAKGLDTSGMAWNGSEFADANNPAHWYTDVTKIGPLAVGAATLGAGLLA